MKKETARASELISPNLIPMIDIMFLLLLFFMLGADMGHRELEDVILPKADNTQIPPPGTNDHALIINAHHETRGCAIYTAGKVCREPLHWRLGIQGRDCTDPQQLALALQRESADSRHIDASGRSISERKVMIRSDAAAPYGLAQRAMSVCAEQGIYRIEVGAARPATR